MIELIVAIIFIFSLLIVTTIIFRKVPILAELPEITEGAEGRNLASVFKERIKNLPIIKYFFSEAFLQKTLSKIRILALKADNKILGWLQKIREKSKKAKTQESENYWNELKNSIDNGKETPSSSNKSPDNKNSLQPPK